MRHHAPVKLARLRAALEEEAALDEDSLLFCDLGLVSDQQDGRFSFSGLGLSPAMSMGPG